VGDVVQFRVAAASRLAFSDLEQVTYEQAFDGMKRIAAETNGIFMNYTLDAAAAYQDEIAAQNRFMKPFGDELLVIETPTGTAAVARYSHEEGCFRAPVLILSCEAHEACKRAAGFAKIGVQSCTST
jgi:hypothetical protein